MVARTHRMSVLCMHGKHRARCGLLLQGNALAATRAVAQCKVNEMQAGGRLRVTEAALSSMGVSQVPRDVAQATVHNHRRSLSGLCMTTQHSCVAAASHLRMRGGGAHSIQGAQSAKP